ncbi:U-box domain-containing protein 33-like isoform X1 [Amaranthus tricolor]|uniref:U-box domain-containing protein 33-like isoform X1 n=1 Tax=Amaranthus tricolor TaxID=29722 RepID=UPI00258A996B|nr:U-box domain-containing protein 33-like isoform X1 [Amaranthus tricolor]
MAMCGSELTRTELSSIVEVEERDGTRRRDKVFVAVGTSEEKTVSLLQWTFRHFRSCDVCLVHVHRPSTFIPTLLGKLPVTQANAEVVAAYRMVEKEKMNELLCKYLGICYTAKVNASSIIVEDEQVNKRLMNLVIEVGMQKLVMGCVKVKKSSHIASYAAKKVPTFCEILFIHEGKLVWTKEAFGKNTISTACQAGELRTDRLRSKSFQLKKSERLYNPVKLLSRSSRRSMPCSGMNNCTQNEPTEEDSLLPNSGNLFETGFTRSSTSNDSQSRGNFADFVSKSEEENLCTLLSELNIEVETSKNEVVLESLKRENLEAEAINAVRKVKDFQSFRIREAQLKKEAEDSVESMMHEHQRLLEEKLELAVELDRTLRSVAVLDSRVQEANHRCDEVVGDLAPIQASITSLQKEKQKIERQKMEAERWLEKWRGRRQTGCTNWNGGLLDDVPELVEFSLADLETATCNFSDSFKLFESGSYSVYKGELLNRTVAIQRLYADNLQGTSHFQKQVQILGKLRHPHLVSLIGACPEACSLVFEYVPNGVLQWHLLRRSNNTPLSWKIRARMISQISSALLFLHSSYPERIIHGDLKLDCILLDSDLHCKICDFGISRLLPQDTFCFHSRGLPEPQGAISYRDPEFYRTGQLSAKSDLYSFGIIILQLVTGQPAPGLVANVRRAVSSGNLGSILDASAGEWGQSIAEKLVDVALRFCEQNSRDRPELTPSLVKDLQQLYISKEQPMPSFFTCPIFQDIMVDPQVAADGFTYDGEAIREWIANGRETSPMTNLKLDHLHLTPNHSLRLSIQEWLCKY